MSDPIQTFDINLQDLTSNEMLVNALTQVAARIDGDIATANTLRANGDAVINAALALLDGRVTVLEQKPDVLTEEERQVIEGFLDRLVRQEGFGSLVSGLNLTVGGVSYSLKSVVESMLAARNIANIEPANYVDGIARTVGVNFYGGEALTINAVESAKTSAQLSQIFGRAVPNAGIHLQYSGQFGAGSVGMERIYEIVPRAFAGVTVPEYHLLRHSTLALSLPGFAAATPVVLGGLDETGDGIIGTPPLVSPLEAALDALNAAIDAKATADAAVVTAQTAVNDATTANTTAQATANAERPAAEVIANSALAAYQAAQAETAVASTADQEAATELAAAEQILVDAQASGDPAQITAAEGTVAQEQADKAATAQTLADKQSAENAAASAYTSAVQAVNAINAAASGASQALSDALAGLQTAQQSAVTAAENKDAAQSAYDALLTP